MIAVETELDMAERHVREGEHHVASQRELLAELRKDGHPTDTAERLLENLEDLLELHREHLARLQSQAS